MRIISGKYKGKKLEGFDIAGTRPTMDRVKESLFAMIQLKLKDSCCLDLFAGSGSLGFEALSQGAKECSFVDRNPKVIATLKQNKEKLQIQEETTFLQSDYRQALTTFAAQGKTFDLIFLDPPYDEHFIQQSIDLIEELNLLNENGLIICEYETEKFTSSYLCTKEKRYGDKYIRLYKKN